MGSVFAASFDAPVDAVDDEPEEQAKNAYEVDADEYSSGVVYGRRSAATAVAGMIVRIVMVIRAVGRGRAIHFEVQVCAGDGAFVLCGHVDRGI